MLTWLEWLRFGLVILLKYNWDATIVDQRGTFFRFSLPTLGSTQASLRRALSSAQWIGCTYFLLPMKRWSQTGAYPHVFSYYFNWDLAWERFHNVPCHICSSFVFTSGVVQLFVFCVSWLRFWVDGAGIRRGATFRVTGGIVHDQLRTYVVDLELGSTPFEGAEHVGVLAEMTFHAMTLIQVLNGWDAGGFVMASDTRNLVCN